MIEWRPAYASADVKAPSLRPRPMQSPAPRELLSGSNAMTRLDSMLRPKSVAVIGASERSGSVGDQTLRQLISGGFTGPVYPVNPGYSTIHGIQSHASIEMIGEPVDLVVLAVSNPHLEAELAKAVSAGARAAVIFASCQGTAADGTPLRDRLGEIADDAGMPICGGNGMGFLNVEDGVRVCGFYQPAGLEPGGVTFLSHSGSLFSALLHNRRGIRFNLVVSSGLEVNTAIDQYVDWALDLESTNVISLFLETIRRPDAFVNALDRASRTGIPVIALKVGTTTRARNAIATHSEALAGEDAVYDALFDRYGVHRVATMDEMADTIELFSAGRRPTGTGLGAVHDSGGERALLIDTAARVGVDLPEISGRTATRIAAVLDPGLEAANPVDAWGTGREAQEVFVECLEALAEDPVIGAVAFCVDLTREENPDDAYSRAAIETAQATGKPVMVIANLTASVDQTQAGALRRHGIPLLEGTESALRAINHLFDHHRRANFPAPSPRITQPREIVEWPRDEVNGLALVCSYGIATAISTRVDNVGDAVKAAAEVGYPVVLKTAMADHKTDVSGVFLGLRDSGEVAQSYESLVDQLGPQAVVAAQAAPGIELALGMTTDPQYGPVVIIASGGVLVETIEDSVAVLPPVDGFQAMRAIDRLSLRPMLDGTRGRPPVSVDALVDAIVRFSELAVDLGKGSVDINPIIVSPTGVTAVDAMFKDT